jgi:hypothetical protein
VSFGRTWRKTARTPSSDSEVVQEKEPFLVEAPREDNEYQLLEILGAISRAKGKPHWEIAP